MERFIIVNLKNVSNAAQKIINVRHIVNFYDSKMKNGETDTYIKLVNTEFLNVIEDASDIMKLITSFRYYDVEFISIEILNTLDKNGQKRGGIIEC